MKSVLYGVMVASVAVVLSGLLMPMLTGLSYERLSWTAYAQPVYPTTETGGGGPAACSDGMDNDNDGDFDCADSDCAMVAPCFRPAPAMSNSGLLLLTIVISTVGLLTLRARSRSI